MFGIHDFGLFIASCLVLNVTPGPDTFYILGRGMAQGRAAGIASALGIGTGALVHTLAAACGLSALLAASASAFFAIKIAGALYLLCLGMRMLLTKAAATEAIATTFATAGFAATFRRGLLTNVLNPKVALFFLAFMPQFIDAASTTKFAAFLTLGLTFVTTGTLWCLLLAIVAARVGTRLRESPRFSTVLNRTAGALFMVLGVRLAVSK